MSTFIHRLDADGSGTRVAVKDLIDMEGLPTTAGCRALADRAAPAEADAPCLSGIRAAGARIVGRVNLHELAFGATGINPWFGTPENPLDPDLVPGGSSSGSAVAVATDEADIALGSDTGGSVRHPSACCGTVGLKTTYGRISTAGVWPLAPSLDTIGPMARDVAGVVLGMQLLEPGFAPAPSAATVVGRVRGIEADPALEAALDSALAASELEVVDIGLSNWTAASMSALTILVVEGAAANAALYESAPDGIGADVRGFIEIGRSLGEQPAADARDFAVRWQAELAAAFERVQVLALPTMPVFPPRIGEDPSAMPLLCAAVNLAGVPALSQPVPSGGPIPASLQLVGPHGSEELLVATGAAVEAAVAR
jgi:amidase